MASPPPTPAGALPDGPAAQGMRNDEMEEEEHRTEAHALKRRPLFSQAAAELDISKRLKACAVADQVQAVAPAAAASLRQGQATCGSGMPQPASTAQVQPPPAAPTPSVEAGDCHLLQNELMGAAAKVVPRWDWQGAYLVLHLPDALVEACDCVRLEVNNQLLPTRCTQGLDVTPSQTAGSHLYRVTGLQNLKPLVQGAELLPCSTQPAEGGDDGWELVLRVKWPPALPGQKVGDEGHPGAAAGAA
jgi:hypothetical protein